LRPKPVGCSGLTSANSLQEYNAVRRALAQQMQEAAYLQASGQDPAAAAAATGLEVGTDGVTGSSSLAASYNDHLQQLATSHYFEQQMVRPPDSKGYDHYGTSGVPKTTTLLEDHDQQYTTGTPFDLHGHAAGRGLMTPDLMTQMLSEYYAAGADPTQMATSTEQAALLAATAAGYNPFYGAGSPYLYQWPYHGGISVSAEGDVSQELQT
ncbi:unnamed protein product, partial [Amoebophrya sp. A25]